MALTTVLVHGQILDPDGLTPAVGTVTFRTLIELRDTVDNIVYLPSDFTATLDVNGEFTINLPTTDNADIVPINWVYQVYISTTTWRETLYVQIPFQVGTVEFADLTPLDYDPCQGLPAPTPIPPSDYALFVLRSGDTMTGPLILDDASEAASQAWVLANAPGGVPANSVVTEQAFGQASAVGVSLEYAREDHTHGTPAAPAVPAPANSVVTEQAFGQASSFGALTTYAREDHTHGTPNAPVVPVAGNTVVTETTFGQGSAAGVSADFSRVDHTHGTPAAPANPVKTTTPALITTGTITVPTGPTATQIGPDLVLAAVTGDTIEINISCLCADTGGELYWNAATRVAGADVTYFGTGTNTWVHPPGGISGWFTPVNVFTGPRGSRKLVLGVGDIAVGNTVTVRIYARADNSSRDVFATAAQPLQVSMTNYGQ